MPKKNLTPREELLAIQKKIFQRNRLFIEESISIQEKGFLTYQRRYHSHTSHFDHVASPEELKSALKNADLIFVGDYHTNPQSQRGFLRILKMLIEDFPDLILALELIHKRYQRLIEDYLNGVLEETEFLKKIHLKKRWYFDLWKNFQPLFDFARYHHLQIYGVESAPTPTASLHERDLACAKKIVEIVKKHPHQKILVLIGDLHIAPPHLPAKIQSLLKENALDRQAIFLYQNSEQIYWQLAARKMEEKTEIVRMNENSFCLMNTPPIVWQQSYIHWLEQEEGEFDYADAKLHFLDLADRIAQFLEITLSKEKEEIEVYTCGDLTFLERLEEHGQFSKKQLAGIRKQVLGGESYFIPQIKTAYLANLSLNHAAEEAAHFVRYLCAGEEFPREPRDAFYANILHEALGFFGSKTVNHQRKCLHEKDYRSMLSYLKKLNAQSGEKRALELLTALEVLKLKDQERQGLLMTSEEVGNLSDRLFFSITHALGYMLGDCLYYGLMSGKIRKAEISALFFNPFQEEGEPGENYRHLLKKVRGIRLPRRV